METITIYHINEAERTIDIAQSVQNDDESIHGAVLNTKTFTFDELMEQHRIFMENIKPLNSLRDRFHSALRVGKSVEVDTSDMMTRFFVRNGENIFFRGFVSAAVEFYDEERQVLLKPDNFIKARFNRNKIQAEISDNIDDFFETNLRMICSNAYFNHDVTMEHFSIQTSLSIAAADSYTFNVFHESDNCLITVLIEIGQLVHRNNWTRCQCVFCHKTFLDVDGETCCRSIYCRSERTRKKEKIYKENTQEYSAIKRDYDSYVRRYKKMLVDAGIEKYYPEEFDEFKRQQKARANDMTALKKKLIANGLSSQELINLGSRYKDEMRTIAEGIMESHGEDQVVA